MSKKRKAAGQPAAAAAPTKGKHRQQKETTTTTPPRSRKAVARANRRARPRDDYYEAEDADAPDAHDTQRFDVSSDCWMGGRERGERGLRRLCFALSLRRHLHKRNPSPFSIPRNTTAEGRQLRVRDALGL